MRVLETATNNRLTMIDPKSGEKLALKYRDPLPSEIIEYHNRSTRREGKMIVSNVTENRLAGGKLVLTGIGEGQLGVRAANNKVQPISSNPDSENFAENWKDHVETHLTSELMLLGIHVFESTRIMENDTEDVEGNSQKTSQQ